MLQEQIDSLQLASTSLTPLVGGVFFAVLALLLLVLVRERGIAWRLTAAAIVVALVVSSCLLLDGLKNDLSADTSANDEATNQLIVDALQERYSLDFKGDLSEKLLTDGTPVSVEHVDGTKQKITLEIDQTGELIGWDLSGNELERVYG